MQVDSSTCYCKVDSGLKTDAGAGKLVRRSNQGIQPSIKLDVHRSKNSCKEREIIQSSLIPGLLDDLAIACLIRVPRIEHRKLHLVCKRWNQLLSENMFYSLRKCHGMAEEWIYVITRNDNDERNSWHAFDPIYHRWQTLPPVPWEFSEAYVFGCEVLSGCRLYLFGGMNSVIFYCARTNKWCRAPDMLRKSHCLRSSSCVINNCLYVAGGKCEKIDNDPRFAEVYDPNQNRWNFISETNITMAPFTRFVHNGTWFLKGRASDLNFIWEAYSPETDTWSPVANGMVKGLSNKFDLGRKISISLNGQIYALDYGNRGKLTVYNTITDSWKKLMDLKPLLLGTSKWLHVDALVPLNGKLCIIHNNMSISLVDVSSPNKQVVSYPYIWKNIAGEGLKGNFVCCQVLEA